MTPEPFPFAAVAAVITPIIGVFTFVDVLRHPAHLWRAAGRSKRTWIVLHVLLLVLPLLPIVLVYLVYVGPHLRRVARSELLPGVAHGDLWVELDGRVALPLRDGDGHALEVPPGEHAVVARRPGMWSAPLVLDVPPGGLIWIQKKPPAEGKSPEAFADPGSAIWATVVERTSSP